jgi:hypothetical protein
MASGSMKEKTVIIPPQVHRLARIKVMYLSLCALLFVSLISCVHQPMQEGGSITDKIFEAYGGRDRIANVMSVAAEGRISSLMRGEAGIYRRALRRDRRLFVAVLYSQSTERSLLDSSRGFQATDGNLEEVFGPRYHALVDQYNELDLPFGLLDNTFTITETGRGTLKGTAVHILRLLDRAGNEIYIYVRTEDYLIIKCISTFEQGLHSMILSTEFSDFRRVEGILFPFRMVKYLGGDITGEITIRAYLLNAPIADAFFKP